MKVAKHCKRIPGEDVKSLSLQMLKTPLDKFPSASSDLDVGLAGARVGLETSTGPILLE